MTELQARAEVVGYSEPVLDAIRDLVREVDANPRLAEFTGQQTVAIGEAWFTEGDPGSTLMAAIGRVLTVAAQVALSKESVR